MYRTTALCFCTYSGLLLICLSPEIRAAEPADIGVPYLLEDSTGKLIPLERQRYNISTRVKGLGFGGGSTMVRFNGRSSPVRIGSNGIKLVIRFASMPPTPSSVISLDVLESRKSTREIVLVKAGPMGFGAKTTNGVAEIELTFQAGSNSTIVVVPKTPLAPSEYVVTLKDNPHGYLFAVQ